MKDAGMRIRVEKELKDAFLATCQKMDVPAAQVIRQHMKLVIENYSKTQKRVATKNADTHPLHKG